MSNITYTFDVIKLEVADRLDIQEAITKVSWIVKGLDENGNEGLYPSESIFSLDDIDTDNFKPFNELKKSDIINWIEQNITVIEKENIESTIKKQIEKKKSNLREKPFPWA